MYGLAFTPFYVLLPSFFVKFVDVFQILPFFTFVGDGFFPIVSREVATRNRKRRKVIHDRQCGRIPGACLVLTPLFLFAVVG
jgi:hypothetical protein